MPQRYPQSGFSLLEIVVSLGIIAIITAISIPGIRNFNQSQQLDTVTSNIVQALQITQSNAASGIQCPNGDFATSWSLILNQTNFQIKASCQNGTNPETTQSKPLTPIEPTYIQIFSTTCGDTPSTLNVEIKYYSNQINFFCLSPARQLNNTNNFLVTIQDTRSNKSKIIQINRYGLITVL